MISGFINALSAAGLCTTRAFLPAFIVSLLVRITIGVSSLHETQFGLVADVMHAQAPWFTSLPFLIIVGGLAGLELVATKSPDAREILREFDVAIKPVMAAITTLGIVSVTDIEAINQTLGVQQEGIIGSMLFPALAAAATLGGTWFRTELYELIDTIDADDSLGIQKVVAWVEEMWVVIGVFLIFVLPLVLMVLLGCVFLLLGIFQKVMDERIHGMKRPCPYCGKATHPSAVYCAGCHQVQPEPVDVSYFGLPKLGTPANTEDHRFRLLRSRRCPSCAAKMKRGSPTAACEECGLVAIESQDHAQAYVHWIGRREMKVLVWCFVLGVIPVVGVIPAAIYSRIVLVSPFRRYMPRWRSVGVKTITRLVGFLLFMLQVIPFLGMVSLPLLAFMNHRMYRASFLSSCRSGLVVKTRAPIRMPAWLSEFREKIPSVRVRGWQLGVGLLAVALLLALWPASSEAAPRAGYGPAECPSMAYRVSGTWTSRAFTETYGEDGSYRIAVENPVADSDKPLVDVAGGYSIEGDALSLSLGRVRRQYRMLLTQGGWLLYLSDSGMVSRYSRESPPGNVPTECRWATEHADGRWLVGNGSQELVVQGRLAALREGDSLTRGRITWRSAGEAEIAFDDGHSWIAYFGVSGTQMIALSENEAESTEWIDVTTGTLMRPAAVVEAEATEEAQFARTLGVTPPELGAESGTTVPVTRREGVSALDPVRTAVPAGTGAVVAGVDRNTDRRALAIRVIEWARTRPSLRRRQTFDDGTGAGGLVPTLVRTTVRTNVHASANSHSNTVRVAPMEGLLVALEGNVAGQTSSLDPDGASRMAYVVLSESVSGWVSNRLVAAYSGCLPDGSALERAAGTPVGEDVWVARTHVERGGRRSDAYVILANRSAQERSYAGVFAANGCSVEQTWAFVSLDGLIDSSILSETGGRDSQTLMLIATRPHRAEPSDGTLTWSAFTLPGAVPMWSRQVRSGWLAGEERRSVGGSRDRLLRRTRGKVLGIRFGRGRANTTYFSWDGTTLVENPPG